MSKDFWQNQFNFVEEVLDSRFGYEVVSLSDEMDRVEFDTKTIFINSRCHPETRFYALLHEYGHTELYEKSTDELCDLVPCYKTFVSNRYSKSYAAKVGTIVEEIEAWKIGRAFAIEQNLWVDLKKFEKTMNDCLMGYIKWASR